MDELSNAVARARVRSELVTLFYIDLDGFKPVNDAFGHDIGDELLIAVAERLRACTRTGDVVARLGGDEFAVLIDAHTRPEHADAVAKRLASAFMLPFAIGEREVEVRASIGEAVFPNDANSAPGLLRFADTAMFGAKRRSPGRKDER